jgi:hypothetical protein
MTYRARLRVELPDRPGALAGLAGALAGQGANVVAVETHEVDGDLAVDELVVDLPDGVTPERLGQVLSGDGVGTLLSCGPPRQHEDPVTRALQWAGALAEVEPADRDDELARALTDVCSATGAWVSPTVEARASPAGAAALDRGAPLTVRTDDVPASLLPELARGAWLLAVPDDGEEPRRVAFLARPPGMRFTTTEIARVVALVRLRRRYDALPALAPVLL